MFLQTFHNIADLLGPKTQFSHFWRGGGVCVSFSRNNSWTGFQVYKIESNISMKISNIYVYDFFFCIHDTQYLIVLKIDCFICL